MIRAALDSGCRHIVLAVGGSATTDGGSGLLCALGARVFDADGNPLAPGGAALRGAERVDLTGLDPRLADCEIVLASDVDNPLLGPEGAAAVFGPQKGAGPDDVASWRPASPAGRCWSPRPPAVDLRRHRAPVRPAGPASRRSRCWAPVGDPGSTSSSTSWMPIGTWPGRRSSSSARDASTSRACTARPRSAWPAGTPPGVPVVAVSGQCTVGAEQLLAAGVRGSWTLLEEAGGDLGRAMGDAADLLERIGRRLAEECPALA